MSSDARIVKGLFIRSPHLSPYGITFDDPGSNIRRDIEWENKLYNFTLCGLENRSLFSVPTSAFMAVSECQV